MGEFTEFDSIRKVVDRLNFVSDAVLIPASSWYVVDYYELASGVYKLVVQVAPGKFIDVRADIGSKLRVVKSSVKRALEAEQELVGITEKMRKAKAGEKKPRPPYLTLVS